MSGFRSHAIGFVLIVLSGGCQWILGINDRKLVQSDAAADADMTNSADASEPDSSQVTSADAGMDAGNDAAVPERCIQYCDSVMGVCVDKYAPYADTAECLAVCAAIPAGDASGSPPSDNSIACRQNQVDLAQSTLEPHSYCAAAGPSGADVCGDNCESYCSLIAQVCPASKSEPAATCKAHCAGLRDLDLESKAKPTDSTYDLSVHSVGELLQCRLMHAAAAALDPDKECWQATIKPRPSENGDDPPCTYPDGVDPVCEDYCRLNMVACTGDQAVYETQAQCMAVCNGSTPGAGIPPGTGLDGLVTPAIDSIGCRIAHSYNAFADASLHCPHSGPGGADVCGDDCASYCRIVADVCPNDFGAAFGTSLSACTTRCNTFSHGPPYAVSTAEGSGDTVVCRLLAATRAYGDATFCAAAFGAAPCAP